ncbi:hypothetical protein [Streptosporangium minutum]|uniref:Uncharacterized protein n=1 Tax=Streptosporangium minutum TaxID=569862 RepID=A0A243RQI1_9ACTN|nr:hypothetical protein [Streptosporangium minutum]OUC96573.1 hypothetical protein CA984_14360 [Streptosporangium minutum]
MKNSTASLVDFNFAAKLSGAIVSGVIAVTAVIGGHAATTAAGTTWDSTSAVVAGTTWDTAGTDGTTWDTASTDGTTWDTAKL